jgi:hypothetical protein
MSKALLLTDHRDGTDRKMTSLVGPDQAPLLI